MTLLPGRGRSQHFGGTVERSVRVNAAAAAYGDAGHAQELAPGSIIVQTHHRPGEPGTLGSFAMVKLPQGTAPREGDWQFLVLDPESKVLARGALEGCARCHAMAPADYLFGPPLR
jgi:hypothetical protein